MATWTWVALLGLSGMTMNVFVGVFAAMSGFPGAWDGDVIGTGGAWGDEAALLGMSCDRPRLAGLVIEPLMIRKKLRLAKRLHVKCMAAERGSVDGNCLSKTSRKKADRRLSMNVYPVSKRVQKWPNWIYEQRYLCLPNEFPVFGGANIRRAILRLCARWSSREQWQWANNFQLERPKRERWWEVGMLRI